MLLRATVFSVKFRSFAQNYVNLITVN